MAGGAARLEKLGSRARIVERPYRHQICKEIEMVKAIWNDAVIAHSDATVIVEGNHYFPPESVDVTHVRQCSTTTECPWKGTARYYDVVVGDDVNPGAAWYYPDPKAAAEEIRGRVAFWKGVRVVE
jgi:uncharacterized protein (DUF427 family)